MKIAVIGTGGVGGYFGGKLANAGFDVTFLARGKHLKNLQTKGLKVKSINETFHIKNIKATDKLHETGKPDLIILGVKAWQIKEIRNGLKAIVHNKSTILTLQNGVSAVEELSRSVNSSNIIAGLCRIVSKVESPGVINHFGVTPEIIFGESNGLETKRAVELKSVFDKAGINSQISKDIEADLWRKFISICMSGLLAITKTTYGELREIKETRQMMIDLFTEIFNLSQKIGLNIEPDYVENTVSFIDLIEYESTTSLARDIWEGRPSEIEYQNGTVVRLGEKYGIDTPVNKFVYHCILPMELKARGQDNLF